jgi:transforming growth factor-beta-induced protein
VFAPTDVAFAALATQLGYADTTAMVTALTKEQLTTILTYHVLSTQVASSAIPFGTPVATVNGETITITAGTAPVIATIADTTSTPATITAVDVPASNGVIHVIDKVLIPSGILPPPG